MKTQKTLSLLLAGLLLLTGLTACKPKKTETSSSGNATGSTESGGYTNGDETEPTYDPTATDASGNPTDSEGNVIKTTTKDHGKNTTKGSGGNGTQGSNSSGSSNTTTPAGDKLPYFNVKDYGAKGNGSTDDSGAIKKAIAAAQKVNGGIVYLPAGRYLMNAGVDVPMGVTIRGESPSTTKKWRKVSNLGTGTVSADAAGTSWLDAANFSGTWIVVNHGAGNVDSHATFQMQGNASLYGLGFVHKDTAPIVNKITVYPPAVAVKCKKDIPYTRDGMTIEDVMLLNAYVGIALQAGDGNLLDHQNGKDENLYSMGRLRVHKVTGGCVYRGMIMKGLLDTVDIQDCRFGYTTTEKTYATQRANNCADWEWYRADGSNVKNIFSYGAKYGILSTPAFVNGSTSMRLSGAELLGQYPLYLSATGQYEIQDCTFTSLNFNNLCTEKTFRPMTVIQDVTSVHQPFYVFNRLTLVNKAPSGSSLSIVTKRDNASAMLVFSDTTFSGWNASDPIISYESGGNGYTGIASFYKSTFKDGNTNSGKLFQVTNVPKGGLQFNGGNLPQALVNNSANSNNAAWFH